MAKKAAYGADVAITSRASELASTFGLQDQNSNKLNTALLNLLTGALDGAQIAVHNADAPAATLSADTWVAVDIISALRADEATLAVWESLGLKQAAQAGYIVSGLVRLADVGKLAALADVGAIQYAPFVTSAGAVPGGAHLAIGTAALNTQGYTGAGVKVGVLSDSYNMLAGGLTTAAMDIASGDLPAAGVQLAGSGDHTVASTDEGRAMLQIVHDIAPGAQLAFATAFGGATQFGNNIRALAAVGSKVIVDDVRYGNQLTFTDDVIRDAIEDVTAAGVSYFTSNGNQAARGIIEAPTFKSLGAIGSTPAGEYIDFIPGTATHDHLTFTASQTGTVNLRMTWASRAPSMSGQFAYSDLDIFVKNAGGTTIASALGDQASTLLDPVEFLSVSVTAGQTYSVWVQKYAGNAPSHVQVNYFSGAQVQFNQSSGVDQFTAAYGHSFTAGGVSVAAVYYAQTAAFGGTNTIESFSSFGSAYHTHDQAGNALPVSVRNGAEITGVDGLNTTFFGSDSDGDGKPNFFGTSASAPSVAAVAALLLQQNPNLTPAQLLTLLQTPADPVTGTVSAVPFAALDAGAGLVDPANSILLGFQGTPNADTINGANNGDSIYGYASNDTLSGNNGDDHLYGGLGADVHNGGAGFDYARYDDYTASGVTAALFAPGLNTAAAAGDTYIDIEGLILTVNADAGYGSNNADILQGIGGNDSLYGQGGNDSVYGGEGNDLLWGGLGADFQDGGNGFDYVRYDDATFPGLTAALFAPGLNTGAAAGDTYANVEGLILGFFDDKGYGSNNADYIYGINGNDQLYGQGGNDNVYGGSGNDLLWGGLGADLLDGGDGFDYARYDDATFPSLVASLSSPGINTGAAAGDTYFNLEGLILGYFDDTGYGSGDADYLYGINGNDTLYGLGGNDNLYGGAGNDTIVGGEGNDTLSGDVGSDAFRFDVAPNFAINADVILDFALGDKIHLENGVFTALVATGVLGASNFRNGAGVTTAADADDFIIYNNSTGDLYYDLDGSGAGSAVKFATLSNMANLTWSDIIVT